MNDKVPSNVFTDWNRSVQHEHHVGPQQVLRTFNFEISYTGANPHPKKNTSQHI